MDYKELIEKIRMVEAGLIEDAAPKCATICHDAAIAIETLLAERDAAVEKIHGECDECIYAEMDAEKYPCNSCHYVSFVKSPDADHWQWRGVQKENGHMRCPGAFGGTK